MNTTTAAPHPLTIDRDTLVATIADMVRIPSVNPTLVPGAEGEAAVAQWIAERLRQTPGIDVELQDSGDGRPNVIASAGNGQGRTLLLNGHTDTVGVAGMEQPYSGHVEGNRLYGRGASDMKSAMSSALLLLEAIARHGDFPGRVVVTFVTDEEHSSIGTQAICREIARWQPDAALVLEPTSLQACIAHKGFVWAEIVTQGFAAHGSAWQVGVDAIAHMGRVIGRLEAYAQELVTRPQHALVGPPSAHLSIIHGGQELSSYPDRCHLEIERRTIPGETVAQVQAELQQILDDLAAADPQFNASMTLGLTRDAFAIGQEAEIVRTLARVHQAKVGSEITYVGAAGWMDSSLLDQVNVPVAIFGPGGDGAHAMVEWTDLDMDVQFADMLAQVAWEFCGGHNGG